MVVQLVMEVVQFWRTVLLCIRLWVVASKLWV